MKLRIIKAKYPKAFQTFVAKRKDIIYLSADIRGYWKEITDFMDKQGLRIYILNYGGFFKPIIIDRKDEKHRTVYVYKNQNMNTKSDSLFKKRNQAETLAIKKAFQILEEKLQEGGK